MKHFEISNQPELTPLSYPSELRPDGLANTYTDSEGNTYLDPIIEHDFTASEQLSAKAISSGEVVEREGRQMVRYSRDTDLVLVSALLNSADGNEGTLGDVDQALSLVNGHLTDMRRKCGILPDHLILDMLAIDRANDHAELLAPFMAINGDSISVNELMNSLEQDVLLRAADDQQQAMINDRFAEFRRGQE